MMRLLRRAVTGTGRHVRPPRGAVLALAGVVLVAALLAGWGWHWATRSASPARTLALAAAVTPGDLRLDSALEVTWTWSVGGTAALEDRWRALVAPGLPPGICVAGSRSGATGGGVRAPGHPELDQALRQLDQAVRSGAARSELERRILGVRAAGAGAPSGGRGDFLARYALARGYGAAGDWASAADVLEPVFEGWLSLERVPDTDRERARRMVESGRVDASLAAEAVHGRYLAGSIAYHRGEPERAVGWFRRSINAVHYLVAARGEDGWSPEGHYQRVAASLGEAGCPGGGTGRPGPDGALTSLDAYAGLVAAYMADSEFRDPAGLPREVARTRLQIDPGDPFAPVLRHARQTGGDPGRTPIPENLLWAASNLQRVYHHNRLRPDPRLEVTRAVLLLHLTRDSTWAAALQRDGGADVCVMLGGLAGDLHADAAALELGRPDYGPSDSARAAVAVQTFARLDRRCGGAERETRVDPAVRSAWIRLGGGYLTRGLGSTYEALRSDLVSALAQGSAAPRVVEERVTPPLERARGHLASLRRGRVPGEMPADLPAEPVRRFVEEWWSAVFADVARTLLDRTRAPDPGEAAPPPLRASEVEDYLLALESAVDHAGLHPGDMYAAGELAPLAAARGGGAELAWRLRTAVRNRPWVAAALLASGVVLLALVALLVHVSAWRYRMFTGGRFFVREVDAGPARGPA